jgi:hypothetical protein
MNKPTPNDDFSKLYNDFIKGLELKEIFLRSANIKYLELVDLKKPVLIRTRSSARLVSQSDNNFTVHQRYYFEAKSKKEEETFIRISCEFVVHYVSQIKLNTRIFDVFKNYTLRLNTWPYFREFVHNTIARLNLPPMIAPLLKA